MRAEIIAVGSELLTPQRIDTNSLFITERLNEIGVDVRVKAVVGDDRDDLAGIVATALGRADLVVLTGGLGPTDDDVTREVVAGVLGLPLEEDPAIADVIRERFETRGLTMPEINRRQAMVPRGASVLENQHGTAPGLWIEHRGKLLMLLPGPPREMRPMVERIVVERLRPRAGAFGLYRKVLRVVGRTESHVEELVQPVYARWKSDPEPIETTILAAPGQVELHLATRAVTRDEGHRRLEWAAAELSAVLGRDLVSSDGRSLEQVVGDLLSERRLRVAVAEAGTGGLVATRLTDVPGSSRYVELAIVAYSHCSKTDVLGISEALMQQHGVVSEAVAEAMARAVRSRARADLGLAATAVAGPGGGTDRKPVGTATVALAWTEGARARTLRLPGGRGPVRFQASQAALEMLRRHLLRV